MNSTFREPCRNGTFARWPAPAVLLLLLLALPAHSDEPNPGSKLEHFRVGFTKSAFRNVNQNDAAAAFRVLSEADGRRFGYVIKTETQIFDDDPTFEAAIKHGSLHLIIMTAWQFLTMDVHQHMKPFFAISENGRVGRRYLILTHRGSGLQTLADLRGKSILMSEAAGANVCRHWLDTLLLANGFGSQQRFFDGMEVVAKPSAAVLPVFFGKKPACVVDEPSFETMKELNPQVGRNLQLVAASENLADIVICLANEGWPTESGKTNTIMSLRELHLEPAGQQILTLFKIDRMDPFQEEQLDTLKTLRGRYNQLRKRAGL